MIPALGVEIAVRLDALSATLSLLVTGVGALVVLYCARYFTPSSSGLGRFAGILVAFAGAMLALVWADDVVVLYVCWELTTVFSFLLVGQDAHKRASRAAAMQALLVTAAGGLTMLVGLVTLAEAAGTYRLSGIVAAAPGLSGAAVTAGVVCVLVGAVSKSALVPFHFWLPSAMAAPTPVSAFLHAAAMVKAGVYLVLRLAPGFADVGAWRPMIAVLGAATMLLGGVVAARQHDLKLLLAHGTVSQLGFMILLAGAGTRDAALAAVGLVVAHALFKSTLFLTVGVIDRCAGTRDLRELSGLWRRVPVLAVAGTLAAASMAGLPPLLGFVTKEGAFEAFLHDSYGAWDDTLLAVAVLGSVLTVAYSTRFVLGAFTAAFTERAGTQWIRPGPLFVASPVLLGLACLAAGPAAALLAPLLVRYADTLAPSYPVLFDFSLLPGNALALGLSLLAVVLGVLAALPRVAARAVAARRPLAAIRSEVTWRALVHALETGALRVTAQTQRGSLAVVVCTVLGVLLAGPGVALVATGALGGIRVDRVADSPAQLVAAVLAVVSTAAAALARRRLSAVLLVGGLGYAVAVIFALAGAPRRRPDPGPRRDHDARRGRPGPAAPAADHHRAPLAAAPAGPARDRRADRGAHRAARRHRARRPDAARGVAGVPVAGLRLRRGPERRQRDPGRHPRLGHHRRALRPAGRRDRRREPGLPRPSHRHPARRCAEGAAAGPGRTTRPCHRAGLGLAARPDPGAPRPPPLARAGSAERTLLLEVVDPPRLPDDHGGLGVLPVRRAQRARRRVRGRAARRARAGGALRGRRALRARRGGAGRGGHAARRGPAVRRCQRPRRAGARRRGAADGRARARRPRPRSRQARDLAAVRRRRLPHRRRARAGHPAQPRRRARPARDRGPPRPPSRPGRRARDHLLAAAGADRAALHRGHLPAARPQPHPRAARRARARQRHEPAGDLRGRPARGGGARRARAGVRDERRARAGPRPHRDRHHPRRRGVPARDHPPLLDARPRGRPHRGHRGPVGAPPPGDRGARRRGRARHHRLRADLGHRRRPGRAERTASW